MNENNTFNKSWERMNTTYINVTLTQDQVQRKNEGVITQREDHQQKREQVWMN